MKSFLSGIKNVLLWSYDRGSWQYDILCLLIVATIFLAPGHYFGDRDRSPAGRANVSSNIASKHTDRQYRTIELKKLIDFLKTKGREELTKSTPEAIALYLQDQLKQEVTVVKYETFITTGGETGYRVWFK
jgi:hypothetical protein